MTRGGTRNLAVWCWLLAPGCSFIFVESPPPDHAKRTVVDCSTSNVAPVLDTVFASLQATSIVVAAARGDEYYEDKPIGRNAEIGLSAGFLVLYTASAAWGYSTVGDCRAAKEAARSRLKRECREDGDCPPGHRCVERGRDRICQRSPEEPSVRRLCGSDSECPPGEMCSEEGVCSPR